MTFSATAAVLDAPGAPFELHEVTLDDPRPHEVVVRMTASGMCGTDLGVRAGHIPFPLPGVLGHEGAGVVEATGSRVASVAPGDHVLLTFTSCGTCRHCRSGHPAYCVEFLPRNVLAGGRADGSATLHRGGEAVHGHFFAQSSFATRVLADERGVCPLSPDADLSLLAPLGCGVQTGAGAVLNVLRPEPGSTLAVFGTGSVGLSAVMAAALTGTVRIIAVDLLDSRLELARDLGATDTVNPRSADLDEALAELTRGEGVTHAVDATGRPGAVAGALRALAHRGTLALVGTPPPGTTADVDLSHMLHGRRIVGVTEGDSDPRVFLPALVDLVRQDRMPLEKLVTPYPFADVNTAAADAEAGTVVKPVLRFDQG